MLQIQMNVKVQICETWTELRRKKSNRIHRRRACDMSKRSDDCTPPVGCNRDHRCDNRWQKHGDTYRKGIRYVPIANIAARSFSPAAGS